MKRRRRKTKSFELSWHRGESHLKQAVKWWGGGDALEKKLWKPKLPEKAHFGSGQCPKGRDKEEKGNATIRKADRLRTSRGFVGTVAGDEFWERKVCYPIKGIIIITSDSTV